METEFDEKLWFIYGCCKEKHYLIGTSRNFNGKIYAWCPKKKLSIFLSINEMSKMSLYCKYWINGYLSGTYPNLPLNSKGEVDFYALKCEKWSEYT